MSGRFVARLFLQHGLNPGVAEANAADGGSGFGVLQVPDGERADVDERGFDGRGDMNGWVGGCGGGTDEDGGVEEGGQCEEVYEQCLGVG
ncbi:hypothetical protein F3Y22_tig00112383pilonHSYRG00481 [Hibiscus syriacus]|uniref:Uncharacterized protein n=1 Tax=Hibiscus syriacus TaxID=106335 RepID=A0A6A2X0G5_HIBSY|nr:hypothetical protein F3Y22_tig00112383pilonHSYRG00481 [Hibiscus syriacus]